MKNAKNDLVGQKFGLLTVRSQTTESHPKEGKRWVCDCECGRTIVRTTQRLTGGARHCGCARSYGVDWTGKRVHFLNVLSRSMENASSYSCRCDCGIIIHVRTKDLAEGRVRSCGCRTRQLKWKGFGEISGCFWTRVKSNAAQRGIPFSLTIEEAWTLFTLQNGCCALSGLPISFSSNTAGHKTGENTASIDRVDSIRGYEIDNIQWVHKTINMMKQRLTCDEFFYFCEKVASHGNHVRSR